ncbi:OsmC family peroxiredoxin [Demequina sp.]|uniref:OsmC family peroxiredoxin n=1 Tax=Demequina sp. TaxID=2050685 RepID=UPI003D11C01F
MISTARTEWSGGLKDGSGTTTLASGVASFGVNWKARSEGVDATTTPEELLAAAHASCYSMALSNGLANSDHPPTAVTTDVRVTFVPGEGITLIEIAVEAAVPGIDHETFAAAALDAKANCPVSQALRAVPIELVEATLTSS